MNIAVAPSSTASVATEDTISCTSSSVTVTAIVTAGLIPAELSVTVVAPAAVSWSSAPEIVTCCGIA